MKQKMKTIGMILTTMILMMLLSEKAPAQAPRGSHHPPMLPDSTHVVQMVDQMATELSLSNEQKGTLVKMNLEHFKKVRAVVAKDKAEREATHEKLEAMRKQLEDQMASVMNDNQKEQLKKFLKEHRPPKEGRPKH